MSRDDAKIIIVDENHLMVPKKKSHSMNDAPQPHVWLD